MTPSPAPSSPLRIALDVDDVVIDLCGALLARYNARHPEAPIHREQLHTWDLEACVGKAAAEELYADMGTRAVYREARPKDGALEGIARLRAMGHHVFFASSCMTGESKDAKVEWLAVRGVIPTGHAGRKLFVDVADKTLVNADLLVDDGAHNIRPWAGKGILFSMPHNRELAPDDPARRARRADDWAEVVELVELEGLARKLEARRVAPMPTDAELAVVRERDYLAERVEAFEAQQSPSLADGSKPTNPKDAIGVTKLPLHMVPATAIAEESLAMLDGASKYGRDNFRAIGVRATVYAAAAIRHIFAWLEGEDDPTDSDATHLGHARACLGIVIDAKWAGKLNDDRKVAGGYAKAVEELTPRVVKVLERHKDRHPRHYTIADSDEARAS